VPGGGGDGDPWGTPSRPINAPLDVAIVLARPMETDLDADHRSNGRVMRELNRDITVDGTSE
jgi:hypothetical protein